MQVPIVTVSVAVDHRRRRHCGGRRKRCANPGARVRGVMRRRAHVRSIHGSNSGCVLRRYMGWDRYAAAARTSTMV